MRTEPKPEPRPAFALSESVLDIRDAAKHLAISESGLYRLARAGRLRISKIGKRSVVTGRELARFVGTL
jgi:Helix-turn-helix domain